MTSSSHALQTLRYGLSVYFGLHRRSACQSYFSPNTLVTLGVLTVASILLYVINYVITYGICSIRYTLRYSTGYISIEEARANWWAGAAALVVALCAFSDLVVTCSWQLQGNPRVRWFEVGLSWQVQEIGEVLF